MRRTCSDRNWQFQTITQSVRSNGGGLARDRRSRIDHYNVNHGINGRKHYFWHIRSPWLHCPSLMYMTPHCIQLMTFCPFVQSDEWNWTTNRRNNDRRLGANVKQVCFCDDWPDDSGACKCTIPVQKGNTSSNNVGLVAHRDQMLDADWSVGSNHVVVVGTLSDRGIHSPVHSGCLSALSLQMWSHPVGVRVAVVVVLFSTSLPNLSNGYERSHHHCHGPYHRLA